MEDETLRPIAVEEERERRESLWKVIRVGCPEGRVPPSLLKDLMVKRGQRGVYRNLSVTSHVAQDGVAVSVHHTGRSYADDLSARYLLYHYPKTKNLASDQGEIQSLRNALLLRLPIFTVIDRGSWRQVEFGYLTGMDDTIRCCTIEFSGEAPIDQLLGDVPNLDESPFSIEPRNRRIAESALRDPRFKFDVLKRYSGCCPLTGIRVKQMVDAAHVVEVGDGGSDSVSNGLLLEKGVHAAFDAHLWTIHPESLEVVTREDGPRMADMGITVDHLDRTLPIPHPDALLRRWENFQEASKKRVA